MDIYEFIQPNDPITFKTDDDKIAFACSVILGRGKTGCSRIDESGNEVDIPSILFLSDDPTHEMNKFVGGDFREFIIENDQAIKQCFSTFCYGSVEDRRTFDDACIAITDSANLVEFKEKHEDRNRSSMSEWVKYAWKYADKL